LPERLAQVHVALSIHGEIVDVEELARAMAAVPTKPADNLKPAAIHDLH
jgi:hypothetical protein